jgi:acyl-CoA-binding protein
MDEPRADHDRIITEAESTNSGRGSTPSEPQQEASPMSEKSTDFERAAAAAKELPERPDDQSMLQLYALYKQGSSGDVQGAKPGFFDFVGAAKYEAWEKLKGTSPEEARSRYVDLVKKLGGSF